MKNANDSNVVTVICGIFSYALPLVGMTVGKTRQALLGRMGILPETIGTVDGIAVDVSTVLTAGQALCFMRPMAIKC